MPEQRIDFNQIQPQQEQPRRIDYNDMTFGEKRMNEVSFMGQTLESGARGFVDNAMNIPNAVGSITGNALAYTAAAGKSLAQNVGERMARFNMATGEPLTPYGGWEDNLASAKNTWPASAMLRGYDAPTSIDLQSALKIAPEAAYQYRAPEEYGPMFPEEQERELTDMGERFKAIRDDALEGYIQRREAQPGGAAAGDVVGDVATMLSMRAPAVSGMRTARLAASQKPAVKIDPGFRRFLQRKADDVRGWAKTSGVRIAETGLEGAVISALQDEDPVSGAGFGAGVQIIGNVTDTVWKHFPGKTPSTKLAYGALATTALIQVFKSLTPGGRDRILESEESAFRKMAAVVALGAMSKAAGFGRPSRTVQDDLGALVDSWHSARRGTVMSLWSEMQNDDSGDIDRVMTKIYEDPSYFDDTAMRRIGRAATSEDVSMGDTIETLMESDRKFRRKLIALREPSGTPNFQESYNRAEGRAGELVDEYGVPKLRFEGE